MDSAVSLAPPDILELDGQRWARTDVCKGSDLVNGRAWIGAFKQHCQKAAQSASGDRAGGRRLLRQVASCGDEPQYWGQGADLPNETKNRILETLAVDGQPSPGKRVKLPTGDEVIFWFNVGPKADTGPPAERVFVTSARCPHQGVCLLSGELREIEDLAGKTKAVIRCPRHNRLFDIATGEGQGNYDTLQCYQARFVAQYRCFYVAVGPVQQTPPNFPACEFEEASCEDSMDVDAQEPAWKRHRLESLAPGRVLTAQVTLP